MQRLDRISFCMTVFKTVHTHRKMYEELLSSVPVLKSLSPEERGEIADVLAWELRIRLKDGEDVVVEGNIGHMFNLVEEGVAIALKKNPDKTGEAMVKEYKKLASYFRGTPI